MGLFNDLLEKKDIIFIENSKDKYDVLNKLSSFLYDEGYVKKSFISAIVDREEKFPTGLETAAGGVAIPHADSKHVNKDGIVVGILKEPVFFNEMGNPDTQIQTKLVFMLSLKNPNNHLEILQSVIKLFMDHKKMEKLMKSKDNNQVYQLLL